MKLENSKWGRNLLYTASIAGALFAIFKFGEYCLEKWEAYQKNVEQRTEVKIIETIKTNPDLLIGKIIEVLDGKYDDGPRIDELEIYINQKFDSIDRFHARKFKYYSIGLRGDGSGKVWYRNKVGKIHRAHFSETQGWYYITDEGNVINIE